MFKVGDKVYLRKEVIDRMEDERANISVYEDDPGLLWDMYKKYKELGHLTIKEITIGSRFKIKEHRLIWDLRWFEEIDEMKGAEDF